MMRGRDIYYIYIMYSLMYSLKYTLFSQKSHSQSLMHKGLGMRPYNYMQYLV